MLYIIFSVKPLTKKADGVILAFAVWGRGVQSSLDVLRGGRTHLPFPLWKGYRSFLEVCDTNLMGITATCVVLYFMNFPIHKSKKQHNNTLYHKIIQRYTIRTSSHSIIISWNGIPICRMGLLTYIKHMKEKYVRYIKKEKYY